MSPIIRLREEAEEDLAEAAFWYKRQRKGLGDDFLDEVVATLQSIAEQPLMYPVVHRGTRRALMHRFPFGIYYLTESQYLVVLTIMHASRHPRRWQKRTE